MNIIKCKEYYYDPIYRVYSKRNFAINPADISSYFDFYSIEMKKNVLRVCLKTGRYHDIDAKFDEFQKLLKEVKMGGNYIYINCNRSFINLNSLSPPKPYDKRKRRKLARKMRKRRRWVGSYFCKLMKLMDP